MQQELPVTEPNTSEYEPVLQLDLAQQLDATDSQGGAGAHEADYNTKSGAVKHGLLALPCCCHSTIIPA